MDDVLEECFGTSETQTPPALPFVSPFAVAPSAQNLDAFSSLFAPRVSAKDMAWLTQTVADASTLQSFVQQQMLNPGASPSSDFLRLSEIQRRGAEQGVDFLKQFMTPNPSQESSTSPPKRPLTPPRDMDASYEVLSGTVLDTIQRWYVAKERFDAGEADLQDLLPALGAIGIDSLFPALPGQEEP